jgi:hypothetical protein
MAGEAALERIDLLPHGAGVGDDTSRPLEQRNHKFKLVDHGFKSSSGPPAPYRVSPVVEPCESDQDRESDHGQIDR